MMIPIQALQIIQTGFKHFFDIDPSLTEHLLINALGKTTVMVQDAGSMVQAYGDKFDELLAPFIQDIRSIRLSAMEW